MNYKKQLKDVRKHVTKTYTCGNNRKRINKSEHVTVAWFVHRFPRTAYRMQWERSPSYAKAYGELKSKGLLGVAAAAGGYVTKKEIRV